MNNVARPTRHRNPKNRDALRLGVSALLRKPLTRGRAQEIERALMQSGLTQERREELRRRWGITEWRHLYRKRDVV